MVGVDAEGLGIEEDIVAAEFDAGEVGAGVGEEAVEAEEGGGVEGIAFVDPVRGVDLIDGGVG